MQNVCTELADGWLGVAVLGDPAQQVNYVTTYYTRDQLVLHAESTNTWEDRRVSDAPALSLDEVRSILTSPRWFEPQP